MIFGTKDHDDETTPPGAESAELVELAAPPAPPLEATLAPEDGAGNRAPAPSSTDTEEDEGTGHDPSSSPVTIRERMAQLRDRPSSPGFGVVGKFDEARADYTAQGDK